MNPATLFILRCAIRMFLAYFCSFANNSSAIVTDSPISSLGTSKMNELLSKQSRQKMNLKNLAKHKNSKSIDTNCYSYSVLHTWRVMVFCGRPWTFRALRPFRGGRFLQTDRFWLSFGITASNQDQRKYRRIICGSSIRWINTS